MDDAFKTYCVVSLQGRRLQRREKLTDHAKQPASNCRGSNCAKNDDAKKTAEIPTGLSLEQGLDCLSRHCKRESAASRLGSERE
jgi:hypothetical protein